MTESKNIFIGIISIILGLIVIIFPLISVFTLSHIAGVGLIFLGIWFIIQSFKSESLAIGAVNLIISIFSIMLGLIFIADIKTFQLFIFLAVYIVGFLLALAGISSLLSGEGAKGKVIGVLGIIVGILFVIMGAFMGNTFVSAALIGGFLILAGIMEIFDLFGDNENAEIPDKN